MQINFVDERFYDERAKLKRDSKQIDTIKANVDDFLGPSSEKEHQTTRSNHCE